jgi:hypothetical protein
MRREYEDKVQNERRKKVIIGIAVSALAVGTLILVIAALMPA